ncbi:MAG: glycosyltransferase [Actinomycetota bacterium]
MFKRAVKLELPSYIKKDPPLVSILIPARNEESNIKRCVNSLLKQDYSNLEIIILDDNSSDNTYNIIKDLEKKDKRITAIKGKSLKKGWFGKNYACYQLSKYANGKYLIFIDADTLHFKKSVSSALASAVNYNLDAASIFAQQITVSIHERMMVPFANFMILCFLPLGLIIKSKNPLFCTAIGQFMLFKKGVYKKIGGHSSVKKEVLEDIKISKKVKDSGYRFMIFDGYKGVYCRMYKSFKEVIEGYTKVLFAAFGYNILNYLTAIILVAAIFLSPFLFMPMAFIFGWPGIIIDVISLQVIFILIIRIIYAIRFKTRTLDIFLHPFAVADLIIIAFRSLYKCKFATGIYWKNRTYDVNDEQDLKVIEK